MPRRWARPRNPHAALCSCAECARLDIAFPGEGRQLVLPLDGGAPLTVHAMLGGG